jgi:hypothetical protein
MRLGFDFTHHRRLTCPNTVSSTTVCPGYFGVQCRRILAISVKYVAPQPIARKNVIAELFARCLATCVAMPMFPLPSKLRFSQSSSSILFHDDESFLLGEELLN